MRTNLSHRICACVISLWAAAAGACDARDPEASESPGASLDAFPWKAVVAQDEVGYALVDDEGEVAGHVRIDREDGRLAAEVTLDDAEVARVGWSSEDAWLQCGDGPHVDEDSDPAVVAQALDACGDQLDLAMLVMERVEGEAGSEQDAEEAEAEFRQCNWSAMGRQMDRYTAMCTGWGYDQGIFTFNGCSVRLDYCIHW